MLPSINHSCLLRMGSLGEESVDVSSARGLYPAPGEPSGVSAGASEDVARRDAAMSRDLLDSAPGLQFVDWMTADDLFATGGLFGRVVVLSGSRSSGCVVDGTCGLYASDAFAPPLPNGDTAYIEPREGDRFTLVFGGQVRDPVVHLASLGSTLTFLDGVTAVKLSGDDRFVVTGSTVAGTVVPGLDDTGGSVQFPGTHTSLSFTVSLNFIGGSGEDGIYVHAGAFPDTAR